MAKPTRLSNDKINEIMASPAVRKALANKAHRIQPRAASIANSAGAEAFAKALRVETGTRPGAQSPTGLKRPYARVIADMDDASRDADRGAALSRTKILRRASGA